MLFFNCGKTAPYLTDRYYLGIGAAAIVVFVYMLSRVCDVSDSGWLRYITLPCVSVLLVAGSHHTGTVNYQSAELQDQRAILQEVESTQYLYVIDENMWKVMGNIQVLDHFDRLYCIEESSLPSIINEKQTFDKTLAVGIISTDTEKTLDFVKETLGYRSCEFLCGSGDTKTYYLKK